MRQSEGNWVPNSGTKADALGPVSRVSYHQYAVFGLGVLGAKRLAPRMKIFWKMIPNTWYFGSVRFGPQPNSQALGGGPSALRAELMISCAFVRMQFFALAGLRYHGGMRPQHCDFSAPPCREIGTKSCHHLFSPVLNTSPDDTTWILRLPGLTTTQ